VGPDDVVAAGFHFQEGGAGAVGFGDEDLRADDDGIGGVDALVIGGAPGEVEVDLAALGLEGEQAAAAEGEAPAAAVDGGEHGAGAAGEVVADLVLHLAAGFVEGDDGRAVRLHIAEVFLVTAGRAAADHDNQEVVLDDGG